MLLPSSTEAKHYDNYTLNKMRESRSESSELSLIQHAGKALYEKIRFEHDLSQTVILCGPGNNGADGVAIATLMQLDKKDVTVILIDSPKYSSELVILLEKFKELKGKSYIFHGLSEKLIFKEQLNSSTLVIDSILGTGQNREPEGNIASLLSLLNECKSEQFNIVSIDVPTGVNCDNGQTYPLHIVPNQTVCVEFIKRGLLQYPAKKVAGNISIVSIGIEADKTSEFSLLDMNYLNHLKRREHDCHKGDFGKLLVIAGSFAMPGAAALVANTASVAGTGLVIKAQLNSCANIYDYPEIVFLPLQSNHFTPQLLPKIEKEIITCSSIIVGPGIGTTKETFEFIEKLFELIASHNKRFVIDADGLNILAGILKKKTINLSNAILTPHPGEAARLLDRDVKIVQSDRYQTVQDLHKLTKAAIVLKGASTVIWDGVNGYVNCSGTPYLATPGSGDVLSGLIGSLLAQDYSIMESAALGVFLHGKAGEVAVDLKNGPIRASDIINAIPSVISV